MKAKSNVRYVVVETWCYRDADWLITCSRKEAVIECKRLLGAGRFARVECRYEVIERVF